MDFEAAAARWLENNGLYILARNFRSRAGELDIIALDGDCLVFVEVRSRRHTRYGGAAGSVDAGKRRRLVRTAQAFLQRHTRWAQSPCRFDVLAYESSRPASAPRWIRGAFSA